MKEVYVSHNGTLYVPYIAVYVFHGYTGTLYVTYMNALPSNFVFECCIFYLLPGPIVQKVHRRGKHKSFYLRLEHSPPRCVGGGGTPIHNLSTRYVPL